MNRRNLLVAAALVVARGREAMADEPPAEGPFGNWAVGEIAGKPALPETKVSMEILADGTVAGSGGCNSFHGSATIGKAGSLSFGPAASTRMMCEPAISDQESAFFKSLEAVRGWRKDGVGLVLVYATGGPALRLTPLPE